MIVGTIFSIRWMRVTYGGRHMSQHEAENQTSNIFTCYKMIKYSIPSQDAKNSKSLIPQGAVGYMDHTTPFGLVKDNFQRSVKKYWAYINTLFLPYPFTFNSSIVAIKQNALWLHNTLHCHLHYKCIITQGNNGYHMEYEKWMKTWKHIHSAVVDDT